MPEPRSVDPGGDRPDLLVEIGAWLVARLRGEQQYRDLFRKGSRLFVRERRRVSPGRGLWIPADLRDSFRPWVDRAERRGQPSHLPPQAKQICGGLVRESLRWAEYGLDLAQLRFEALQALVDRLGATVRRASMRQDEDLYRFPDLLDDRGDLFVLPAQLCDDFCLFGALSFRLLEDFLVIFFRSQLS